MIAMPAAAGTKESRYEEAMRLAAEARYWATRYFLASARVERASKIIEKREEGGSDA